VTLEVIILAAGQGTRMRSQLPKVLHPIAGQPMLAHVIATVRTLSPGAIHVVVGHGVEQVKAAITEPDIQWVLQAQQLGTGHAVAQAMPTVAAGSVVLIAYGDVPLVTAQTLAKLVAAVDDNTLSLLTVKAANPSGYGRIIRNPEAAIVAIVEQKDASAEQLAINEVNTGILAVKAEKLNAWLPKLSAKNAQGEYYLTDIIAMAVADGMQVQAQHPANMMEVEGANNRQQLAALERFYQQQQANDLMLAGASLADPNRIDIRGKLTVGEDVFIDINCIFIGTVAIGNNVTIGPHCVLENSTIGAGTVIKANSILDGATVGINCDIGPFARLRPGTVLSPTAKIGNFVETKKAIIGEGSKVNHLSYIGDSNVAEHVNIGAGTITCNYDGVNKAITTIGAGAFIGSNTALVAPVTIGKNATIGAGSTISADVGDNQLSVARGRQRNIDNWQRPSKK
jgi:bifunctional UDP-N-acetylglucosamine pyrophosphorylase/glucosamine-1-phosphate N-acetyltransferase